MYRVITVLNLIRHDLILLFALLLAGYRYTLGLENVTDIGLYDETNYLSRGINGIANGLLPSVEWAPFYSIWYFLLSQWQPDALALYYVNYKVLTIGLALVTYILLKKSGQGDLISIAIAFLILLSYANLPIWPKVSHFSLIVIMLFLFVSFFLTSQPMRLMLMMFGALVASYIRPEFFLTSLLLTTIWVGLILFKFRTLRRHDGYAMVALLLVSSLMIWGLGVPVGQGRSFLAFGQHFSWNWVVWTNSPLSPWVDMDEITQQVFGAADTIGAAMISNPQMFFKHVIQNMLWIPIKFVGLFFVHAPILLRQLPYNIEGYLLLAGAAISIFIYRKPLVRNLKINLRLQWLSLTVVLCYVLPGLFSAIVIYPRTHYLITASILLPFCLVWLLAPPTKSSAKPSRIATKWVVAIAILGVIITPATAAWYRDTPGTPRLDTIMFINGLEISAQTNVLEAEGGYDVYLGKNFKRVPEHIKSTSFNAFHREQQINMLVVTEKLKSDSRFVDDPEWHAFLQNYEAWGYRSMEVIDTTVLLLVHEQLLTNQQLSNLYD